MERDDLADEHGQGRGERIFGPLLVHSPLASVPSLAHTRYIWHRFPPTLILNRFCDPTVFNVNQIIWCPMSNLLIDKVYWQFQAYIVTCVGQKSASHIPAPHLSPDSPSGPFSRCWYSAGRGLLCFTRLQNGVAASLLQPPSIAENLPEG